MLEVLKSQIGEKVPVEILNTVRKVALQKKPAQTELKAGEKTYSITFTPLLAGEGIILCASDITPLKQTEEKLLLRKREQVVFSRLPSFLSKPRTSGLCWMKSYLWLQLLLA